MTFFCLKCPNCDFWNSCDVKQVSKYVFKCRRCLKIKKLKETTTFGLSVESKGPFSRAGRCMWKTKEMNISVLIVGKKNLGKSNER